MRGKRQNRVIVIGDIILDQYDTGDVKRISPEAPVPVVKMKDSYCVLGGAANVAGNIASLGGDVELLGIIGEDRYGSIILDILKKKGIGSQYVIAGKNLFTNRKTRVLGNDQQIARLDYYDDMRPETEDLRMLVNNLKKIADQFDVIILSDYAKGVCTPELCQEVIDAGINLNKKVLVDPKGDDWGKYKGATILTPNLKELQEFLHQPLENKDNEIEEKCQNLQVSLGISNLLITRSEKGMTLLSEGNQFHHFPSKAKEVYDVSGAGDTAIGVLALYMGSLDMGDAVRLANTAAGIAVSKKGTATISEEELREELQYSSQRKIRHKIVKIEKLLEQVKKWKEREETVVFTNGCFDLFHKGHVAMITAAADLGEHLIVAVNSDDSVKRLKGPMRPINSEYDRAIVIASLGCVDHVIIFEEDTPEMILREIRPDILVKGADYKEKNVVGKEYAGQVKLVSFVEGYSTTGLIHKLQEKNK